MTDSPICHRRARFSPEQPWFVFSAADRYSLVVPDNPMVSHYYSFSVDDPSHMTLAIPDGCVDMVFDCDSTRPAARICGTPFQARRFELLHGHRYFGMRFAQGIVPKFSNLSASELNDGEYNLLDIIPEAEKAFERIVSSQSLSEQMQTFIDELYTNLNLSSPSVTVGLIGTILRCNGNLQMNKLEDFTGYTSRTIQRQFREHIGMSPKVFSRIVRCQAALKLLNQINDPSLLNLALELGFSDQPHFQREFKQLICSTPLDLQKRITHDVYLNRIQIDLLALVGGTGQIAA